MIRAFVLVVLAAGPCAVAAAQEDQAHPLTFTAHGHATTPVVINGMGPFAFIVDTAASAATVSSALTEKLGLLPEAGMQARVQGGGGVEAADFYVLHSLVVAGVESRERPAAMLDRVQHDYSAYGVIGSDVLSQGVLALDLPNGRLSFGKPGDIGDASGDGWVSVPSSSTTMISRWCRSKSKASG
jgi:hypothetical protein